MNFAPVLIITLCRFEHFKKCILSLAANSYADQTIVYVALDFPAREKHHKGYKAIQEYLSVTAFPFKEMRIIKRSENYGASKNYEEAQKEVFKTFDRLIFSEDDNVFSMNFLEYINKNLDFFQQDKDVFAICGFGWPISLSFEESNVMRQQYAFSAWGYGMWRDRYEILKKEITREVFFSKINSIGKALKLWQKSPKYFSFLVSALYKKKFWVYDGSISLFLYLNNKYVIIPAVSKVLNEGFDGSGCGCSYQHPSFKKQILDKSSRFFEIKKTECNLKNSKIFLRIDDLPYAQIKNVKYKKIKFFLKCWVKYFCLKFFPLKMILKISDGSKNY